MKGHIKITDKVYFVPDGLKKPHKPPFSCNRNLSDIKIAKSYLISMVRYEASKKTVEVSNVETIYEWPDEIENPNDDKIYGYSFSLQKPDKNGNTAIMIKNNTYCEAEVIDTAIITKLL